MHCKIILSSVKLILLHN